MPIHTIHNMIVFSVLCVTFITPNSDVLANPILSRGEARQVFSPQLLRVSVPLKVLAKDFESAQKMLEEKVETAKNELIELGADQDSLRKGIASIDQNTTASLNELIISAQDISSNLGVEIPAAKALESANSQIAMSLEISMDWNLGEFSSDQRESQIHQLLQSINRIDFTSDRADGLSPELQEIVEEQDVFVDYDQYGNESEEMTTPVAYYVTRVTKEQRAALMKQAFESAKENATELAEAAGVTLGDLNLLKQVDNEQSVSGWEYQYYRSQAGNEAAQMKAISAYQSLAPNDKKLIVMGADPENLSLNIVIEAGFAIKSHGE